jgi:hypothetical protein
MHQQLWGYKVEEKLYRGVREQKRLNTTALEEPAAFIYRVADLKNACSRFLRNISASKTHWCLSTTPHFAVEWYSRYQVQISAQRMTVIAEVPVVFLRLFRNILGTCLKLRHDRYLRILPNSSFTEHPVTRWKQLTVSLVMNEHTASHSTILPF